MSARQPRPLIVYVLAPLLAAYGTLLLSLTVALALEDQLAYSTRSLVDIAGAVGLSAGALGLWFRKAWAVELASVAAGYQAVEALSAGPSLGIALCWMVAAGLLLSKPVCAWAGADLWYHRRRLRERARRELLEDPSAAPHTPGGPRRPDEVTFLAVVALLAAVALLAFLVAFLALDGVGEGSADSVFAGHALILVLPVLWATASLGLWRGRRWAWPLAVGAVLLGIGSALVPPVSWLHLLIELIVLALLSKQESRAWCRVLAPRPHPSPGGAAAKTSRRTP